MAAHSWKTGNKRFVLLRLLAPISSWSDHVLHLPGFLTSTSLGVMMGILALRRKDRLLWEPIRFEVTLTVMLIAETKVHVDEMKDVLRYILQCIQEAEVPQELREVAFAKVFDHVVGKGAGPGGFDGYPAMRNGPAMLGENGLGESADDLLARIAEKLRLNRDVVKEVFSIDDGTLTLLVPSSRLEKAKAGATRQIALLVAGGRQAAGIDDEWTSIEEIREVCNDFGKYDAPNFSHAINSLDQFCSFKGKGQKREVRLNRQGFEEVAQLVTKLSNSQGVA